MIFNRVGALERVARREARLPLFRRAPASIGRLALLALLAACLRFPHLDDERLAGEAGKPGEAGAAPRGGVLVTRVAAGSAPQRAGLAAGDLVLGWRRAGAKPSLPAPAGEIATAFDWLWVVTEQAPRGAVRLIVERRGRRLEIAAGQGVWDVQILPRLPPALVPRASACRDLEARAMAGAASAAAGTLGAAAAGWEALAAGRDRKSVV